MDTVYTTTYKNLITLGMIHGIERGSPMVVAIGTLENLFNCKITSGKDKRVIHNALYNHIPINFTFETPEDKTKFMLKYL